MFYSENRPRSVSSDNLEFDFSRRPAFSLDTSTCHASTDLQHRSTTAVALDWMALIASGDRGDYKAEVFGMF